MYNNNEKIMELSAWIARDSDGRLYINFSEPRKNTLSIPGWRGRDAIDVTGTKLDKQLKDLLSEDPPLEVVIKI